MTHLDPRGRHPCGVNSVKHFEVSEMNGRMMDDDLDKSSPVQFMSATPCMTRAAASVYIVLVEFFDRGTVKMLKKKKGIFIHGVDYESEK